MKKLLMTAAAAVFVVSLFANTARTASENKLVIVSPHWEGIRTEFTRSFKAWYKKQGKGDIELTWIDQGGSSDDLRYIKSGFERSPKGIGADVFYGGGIDPYMELAKAGLLVPYRLPEKDLARLRKELNGVPLYDSEFRWYGASVSGFGILYNKKLLKMYNIKYPVSWAALASPDLFNIVGSGDPRHSGTVHVMYEAILQSYGWERGWDILLRMGGNVRSFPKSSSQTIKDLSAGDVAEGLSLDSYAFSAIEETGADRLGFTLPAKSTVITPDPIGILKGAKNAAAAQDLIRFVLSAEGQRLWLYKKGVPGGPKEFSLNKMSVLPELYKDFEKKSNVLIDPFKEKKGFTYDFEKATARWNLINDLVGALIIDTHEELAKAWEKTSKGGDNKKIAAILKVPVTEDEAMKLATGKWNDEVARNKVINGWLTAARKRYKSVE
jgi:ABC-type Fe3+ transport system substrate-binding protein